MNYRVGSHTKFKIEYHCVWATKYRYPLLNGEIAHRVRELTRQICERLELHILRGVISKDHVHLLVSAPPKIAPAEIMRRIKGQTSSKLFEEYPHLKKRDWGRHFWARGYFCCAGSATKISSNGYFYLVPERLKHRWQPARASP